MSIEGVLAAHHGMHWLPDGWMCECGHASEMPPEHDAHVATAIREYLLTEDVVEEAALAIQRHSMPPRPSDLARAALTAITQGAHR